MRDCHQRDEIAKFCNNHQLHKAISDYKHILAQIDIQQIQFTNDTVNGSFRSIGNEVFTHRPVSNGYIIAILGFTKAIHTHHCSSSWYTIDILANSLVNVLEGSSFHPEQIGSFSLYYIVIHLEIYIHLHVHC